MEELYLNDERIGLMENSVRFTYQINEIGELKDRQADYSNSIKLPNTDNNVRVMDMLGLTGSKSRVPYVQVSVKYVVNGIEQISNGKGIVKSTNNFYNLVIYDGNISIFDLLGKSKLSALDFSTYNHDLTTTSWLASFSATSGYIYGQGKFYDNATENIIDIDLQGLSFYIHTLFSEIFTQKGFTISGDVLTDTDFKSRVTTMNNGYDRTKTDNVTTVNTNSSNVNVTESFGSTVTTKEYEIHSYTALSSITYDINLNGLIDIVFGTDLKFAIRVNGVLADEFDIPTTSFDFTKQIQVVSGEEITVNVEATSELSVTQRITFNTVFTTIFKTNDLTIPIKFEDLIGDVQQIDFVKTVMQHFGLMIRKTRNSNNYEFKKMNVLLQDKDTAEDWSDKYSTVTNEIYTSNYGQTNLLKYKYDDNDSDTELVFADGEFFIDDVNLPVSKTLFTSEFKASQLAVTLYKLNNWILKDSEIVTNVDGIRMFKITTANSTFNYRYSPTVLNFSAFTGNFPKLDFTDLDYQSEIHNYYKGVYSMLNDYRKVTCLMNLSVLDSYNLDFFKLKYIKQLGQYYYLNKVFNFQKNKLTRVELVEVNDYSEIDPPSNEALPFTTEWTVSASDTITMPTINGGTYSGTINWGDNTGDKEFTVYNDANLAHTYVSGGVYDVTIKGSFTKFDMSLSSEKTKLTDVKQWGGIKFNRLSFRDSTNLTTITATDLPIFLENTSLIWLFRGISTTNINGIEDWDMINVISLRGAFLNNTTFNQAIGGWDTRNVTTIQELFFGASIFNQPIGDWDLSKCITLESTFDSATNFNQNINTWNITSLCTNLASTFKSSSFNGVLSNWDVSGVTTFVSTFSLCPFNQDLSEWDTSSALSMVGMFSNNTSFNQDISTFNTSNVTSMLSMFAGATSFNQDISGINISSLTNATNMFVGVTLSVTNYTALLVGWDAQTLQSGVTFSGGNSKYEGVEADNGTTDGTTANKLVDTSQNFVATVTIGDVVVNTTDDTHAIVTNIDSNTILSISVDIMTSGEVYSIQTSPSAKAKANMIISDGWTITDGGGLGIIDTTPPSVPNGLTVEQVGTAEQIFISWTASTDNVAVDHYEVWKSLNDSTYFLINSPVGVDYTDNDVEYDVIYYYKVLAVDTSDNKSALTSAVNETPVEP